MLARVISVADTYDVMTARDTYREPVSSYEAVIELRRVAGAQLDARFVEAFVRVLDGKDLAYRHGEDADFEAELALDKRIHDYVAQTPERRRACSARLLENCPNPDSNKPPARPRCLRARCWSYRVLMWVAQLLRKPMVHLLRCPITRQSLLKPVHRIQNLCRSCKSDPELAKQ